MFVRDRKQIYTCNVEIQKYMCVIKILNYEVSDYKFRHTYCIWEKGK